MPIDYKKVEFSLHEILVQIENAYELMEFDSALLEQITQCKELVKTRRYKIAVMGEFKRGKSSLINALLGSKILPADATPTTATINRITYAPTPKTVITYKYGSVEEIDINELSEYVTKLTSSGEHRAPKIKEATIYYPTVICQNYVDIIDTPGLNDEERMTKITLDMLDQVDAVIVPIHARSPFSETEKRFVCQLIGCEGIRNIVFVMTFIDQLFEDDEYTQEFVNRIKGRIQSEVFTHLEKNEAPENILKRAHIFLDDLRLYGVSSSMALKAFVSNNRSDLKKSGFETFSNELMYIVAAKQVENTVAKGAEQIRDIIEKRESQNKERLDFFSGSIEALGKSFNIISSYSSAPHKYMDTIFLNSDDALKEILKGLFVAKNNIVSLFIKSLSKIRLNTHEEIEKTILSGGYIVGKYMNEEYLTAMKSEIVRCFEHAMESWTHFRQTSLLVSLDALGYPAEGREDIQKSMIMYVKDRLEGVSFSWSVHILPNEGDLADCNVIEHIIYATDSSIDALKADFDDCITDIRKNWFSRAKSEAEGIKTFADAAYSVRRETLDRKMMALINNYQVFDKTAKDILERCNQIENDISGGH